MTTPYRPPVIAGHRMVKVDSHRVLMFGGRGEKGLSDTLWLLDLNDRVSRSDLVSLPYNLHALSCSLSPMLLSHSLSVHLTLTFARLGCLLHQLHIHGLWQHGSFL